MKLVSCGCDGGSGGGTFGTVNGFCGIIGRGADEFALNGFIGIVGGGCDLLALNGFVALTFPDSWEFTDPPGDVSSPNGFF